MSGAEIIALLLLCTAVSFTPGPNTTLSTALAANFGLRRAMRFVLAVPVGWGLLAGRGCGPVAAFCCTGGHCAVDGDGLGQAARRQGEHP